MLDNLLIPTLESSKESIFPIDDDESGGFFILDEQLFERVHVEFVTAVITIACDRLRRLNAFDDKFSVVFALFFSDFSTENYETIAWGLLVYSEPFINRFQGADDGFPVRG